ncbi:glutamine--fructose-6-phosphate transaminase (isomerizing) [Methanomicrobium antiquum]|uniref:Glutamine--fructose-6-phosphate aminotransferase [isomerizing] n=1 Tax=Methanomicrobium antiquum TaxID=487686 RepID=A0AAF0FQJ3_9EURY|nr:glutamine--fructose-6-phosphate transaminase (isomerizing) [Methanomicrobium antiquum]MDD3976781.1 glutamine--fructose-6-phosphate transaminase (isomerizing) [Methanomicrobium sp.]WFN36136.1 glutamine--fructose-6-phosphate transaminase (isomerizing) [Methanomicrobium antiquum]
MCGIVGYIGRRNAAPVVVEGLKRLEYRGYDSFGVAIADNGIEVVKKQGRISDLGKSAISLSGPVGIGHTRWATHGVPNDINAHPHTDCEENIAVVHNGIIENYTELKRMLESEGHTFKSDTDTEVIPHLIEKYYAGNLLDAVFKTADVLKGSYAFLAVCGDERRIVAAKKSSPLVIGMGDGEMFASSDMTPVIEYTQKMIFLEDGDFADISDSDICIYNSGEKVVRMPEIVEWDFDSAKKGGFEHFMQKEIFEQPDVFYNSFAKKIDEDVISALKKAVLITVVACGTSYHAGIIFRYLMEKYCKIPVRVEIASEFSNFTPCRDSVMIAVTQSGETADTLSALKSSKSENCTTFAITNVLGSSVTRAADHVLYTLAGPEISVAATKSFTAQVAVLLKIVSCLSEYDIEEELSGIHAVLEEALMFDAEPAAELCKNSESMFFVGRGVFYPVSLEGALKMKEITYIHAEGYAAGELKHGPFSLLCENTPVIALCTKDESYPVMMSNIKEIKARGAPVIAIGTGDDIDLMEICDLYIPLPDSSKISEIITASVILQVLAYKTAVLLGRDVDKPRNLAKSVTVI